MKRLLQSGIMSLLLMAMLSLPGPLLAGPEEAKKITPIISFLLLAGEKFNAIVTGILNDTGIDFTGDPDGVNPNDAICSNAVVNRQDCQDGRDATQDDDSDGHAGFSFVKLNSSGEQLAASATNWSCVGDKITGLMWEIKDPGNGIQGNSLHDADDTYTWYDTNSSANGGDNGTENTATSCFGRVPGVPTSYCNTQAYVARVNAATWCDHADWRLPTREELRSIVDYSRSIPAIDTTYFPQTVTSFYWSSSPLAGSSSSAWGVNFNFGNDGTGSKGNENFVRLVRGGQ